MRLRKGSFYESQQTGLFKYLGESEGAGLIEQYIKSPILEGPGSGWQVTGTAKIDRHRMEAKILAGIVRRASPPL